MAKTYISNYNDDINLVKDIVKVEIAKKMKAYLEKENMKINKSEEIFE